MKPVKDLHSVLVNTWGYEDFRPLQKPIVDAVYEGRDGLAILSTGGGKSLCFQVPALTYEGTAIVISPLISLMKDQVDALRDRGVAAGMVNSSLDSNEVEAQLNTLRNGGFKIFYVAPERLITPEFVDILKQTPISFFAIDEAHCISLWGHNFRLSYRGIAPVIRQIEEVQNRHIQRIALTATAKPETQRDIIESLEMRDPFHIVGDFDRENIEINVRKSVNKNRDLRDIIENNKEGSIIIYCATVKAVEATYAEFRAQGYNVGKYHSQMSVAEKNRAQDAFLADEINIIFATNAFGMGVDKADVRVVVHYQLPGTLEAYFQEIGRAGRDGLQSASYLLWSEGDRNTQDFFVRCSVPEAHAVEGMRHALSIYANEEAFNDSKTILAGLAPENIKDFEVDAILRVLVDEGVVNIKTDENYPNYVGVDVIDPHKELDLSYLAKSRKVTVDNLNAMERFARTELCRRRILLRYFGEQLKEKNCGNCDVCLGLQIEQTKTRKLIAPEVINSALSSAKHFTGLLTMDRLGDFLLGVKITSWSRKGYDSLSEYGALKHWTKSNVKSLLTRLANEGYIGQDPRKAQRVFLTDKGHEAWQSVGRVSITQLPEKSDNSKENSNPDLQESGSQPSGSISQEERLARQKVLHELRSSLADQHDTAPFMVFSEEVLKKLAELTPTAAADLKAAGLSSSRIEKYGAMILGALKESNPTSDSSPAKTKSEGEAPEMAETPVPKLAQKTPVREEELDDPGIPF